MSASMLDYIHGSLCSRVHGLFGEQCTNISRGERKGMQCGEKCAIIPSMDDDRLATAAAATNQDYTLLLCILQHNNLA